MSTIYYKVEWLQEICGMNFCVARTIYNEKKVGNTYELFVLKHNKTIPVWTEDFSIASYSVGRYFEVDFKDKGLITEYFQKIIQDVITEEIHSIYECIEKRRREALGGFYPSWEKIDLWFNLDRYEMEQICLLLMKLGYLNTFYTTSAGVCLQLKAKNLYEKIYQTIFLL